MSAAFVLAQNTAASLTTLPDYMIAAGVPLIPVAYAVHLVRLRDRISICASIARVSRAGSVLLYDIFLIIGSMYYARSYFKKHDDLAIVLAIILFVLVLVYGGAVNRELDRAGRNRPPSAQVRTNDENAERTMKRISFLFLVVANTLCGLVFWYLRYL